MLHQAGDICIVFQHKYGLAQPDYPQPAAVQNSVAWAARIREQITALRQINCKRMMNLARKPVF
jgi:hypothetical protein